MVDVYRTFGALMIGGIVAAVFSGFVTAQTFAYFKHYTSDPLPLKALVGVVWLLDLGHTVFVSTALWDHLIAHFGDVARIDFIPWSLAMTIALTAILTFLVHLFFVYRIFKLSPNNYYIAIPLALLACARLCFACLTTAKMITLRSLTKFIKFYTWSFSCGLSLSSLLDILITTYLCYLLLRQHKTNSSMNHILDSLMLYAFENGSLTCAATVTSLICWLAMHTNLIFMAIHFVISKLYANSLLASLNARRNLHQTSHRSQGSGDSGGHTAIMFSDSGYVNLTSGNMSPSMKVKINQSCVNDSASNALARSQSMKTSESDKC
jgi:hypothetical protein